MDAPGPSGEIAGLLGMEAAGIEPATRRKQNPKQVALLPANSLISHRVVPPLRPVSSRLVPFSSPLEGHTGGTCGPTGSICSDASGPSCPVSQGSREARGRRTVEMRRGSVGERSVREVKCRSCAGTGCLRVAVVGGDEVQSCPVCCGAGVL